MPNYFYVRDDGGSNIGTLAASSDTPYSTIQTGTFPANANCYASLADAFDASKTTDVNDDDVIVVANDHNHSYSGASVTIALASATDSDVTIISVDPSNCDQYLSGATEAITGSFNYSIGNNNAGKWFIKGLTIKSAQRVHLQGQDTKYYLEDCGLELTGINAGDRIFFGSDGNIAKLVNCTLTMANVDQGISIGASGKLTMYNCTSIFSGWKRFVQGYSGNGTAYIEAYNCDFTNITEYLINSQPGDLDGGFAKFYNCQMNASAAYSAGITSGKTAEFIGCAATSGPSEYAYYYEDTWGTAEDEDDAGVYRNESTAWPSGTKTSLKIITKSTAKETHPFSITLPSRFAPLSAASTATARIYLASSSTLNKEDVWAEFYYMDGTNNHVPNYVTTRPTIDLDTSAGALTTDSGSDWRNGAGAYTGNEYYIDLDTSGDPGKDGVPIIVLNVGVASATIYVDTTVNYVT
jgi:hypothetical protein